MESVKEPRDFMRYKEPLPITLNTRRKIIVCCIKYLFHKETGIKLNVHAQFQFLRVC